MLLGTSLQLNNRYVQAHAARIQGVSGQYMFGKAQANATQQIALEQPVGTNIEELA